MDWVLCPSCGKRKRPFVRRCNCGGVIARSAEERRALRLVRSTVSVDRDAPFVELVVISMRWILAIACAFVALGIVFRIAAFLLHGLISLFR